MATSFRVYYECAWVRMEYVSASGCMEPIEYAKQFNTRAEAMTYYEANKARKDRIKVTVSERTVEEVLQYFVHYEDADDKKKKSKKTKEVK